MTSSGTPTTDRQTLEIIATQAGDARRLEYEAAFFKTAMRSVPVELQGNCELVGVGQIEDAKYGNVRIKLFGTDFDFTVVNSHDPEIRHATLPLSQKIERLEDYSFERAARLEQQLRRQWLLSYRPPAALAILTLVLFALGSLSDWFIALAWIVFTLALAAAFASAMTYTPERARYALFPKRVTTPDAVSLEAFEQWRGSVTLEAQENA